MVDKKVEQRKKITILKIALKFQTEEKKPLEIPRCSLKEFI